MEEESLRSKTKKGLYWKMGSNLANTGMAFIFSIILARLLAPDAYGVIGMLGVFMAIVGVFIDCGFSQALITKQDRTQVDFSTEFWFNIVVGLVGYSVLFIASPFIAKFYNMPILSPILRVIGLQVVINSLCVVQGSQFAIRLDFKTPAKLSVVSQITTGVIGILLAYLGWGVWALVFQSMTGCVLNAILLWVIVGWRPSRVFSKESFKYQWNYGSKILGASLIQQVYDNLYPLVIGKFFSSKALGLYSRAQGFASLPSSNISGVLGSVTMPVLSKINNDMPRLTSVYRRMIKTAAFIVFPMMLGLAAVADPLIKVLLNAQWYPCIPYLQLLCIAMIWQPISYIHLSILKVAQRTDVVLKLEIIKRIAGITSIACSVPFGVIGMCKAYILLYVFCFALNTVYTSKTLKVSFTSQIIDISGSLICAILMALLVYLVVSLIHLKLVSLILGITLGVVAYLTLARIFLKEQLSDAISLVVNKKF